MTVEFTDDKIARLFQRLEREAADGGYNLNPDREFTRDLVEALLINSGRYGYQACPCRLADGSREKDLDIICPCDYRDPDLAEYGSCYCALYVSGEIARGEKEAQTIPERRVKEPDTETRRHGDTEKKSRRKKPKRTDTRIDLAYPVWRCPVCGYLCAREHPPEKCPVCKADKDRFQRFL